MVGSAGDEGMETREGTEIEICLKFAKLGRRVVQTLGKMKTLYLKHKVLLRLIERDKITRQNRINKEKRKKSGDGKISEGKKGTSKTS